MPACGTDAGANGSFGSFWCKTLTDAGAHDSLYDSLGTLDGVTRDMNSWPSHAACAGRRSNTHEITMHGSSQLSGHTWRDMVAPGISRMAIRYPQTARQ